MKLIYTAEQLDYLTEMMNIGAGNAATALSQLLDAGIDVKVPRVNILADPEDVSPLLNDPSAGVTGVKMKLVGDIRGDVYFVVEDKMRLSLVLLTEKAVTGRSAPHEAVEVNEFTLSALSEIGNILAGVYLTAINNFCGLTIFHSVPIIIMNTADSIIKRHVASDADNIPVVIFVENEFIIGEKRILTWFILIVSEEYMKTLTDSMKETGLQ